MEAFKSVRTQMRENGSALTHPYAGPADKPMRRKPEAPEDDDQDGPIEPWMAVAFAGLTHASVTGEPYDLIPCYMNGEPAVVLAITRNVGRQTHVMPLFLACQPWMQFSGQPGDNGGEEEGGGPDRTDPGDSPEPS